MQERNAINNIHHPWTTNAELATHYPSHLHINLLPRLQGRGLGRKLIAALTSELRDRGSAGVHLAVRRANHRAVAFYRYVGFTELPGSVVHVFGMALEHPPR